MAPAGAGGGPDAAPPPATEERERNRRRKGLNDGIKSVITMLIGGSILYGVGLYAPTSFMVHFTIFVLSCFVGWQVIWNVTPALHTPLMSVDQRDQRHRHRRAAPDGVELVDPDRDPGGRGGGDRDHQHRRRVSW